MIVLDGVSKEVEEYVRGYKDERGVILDVKVNGGIANALNRGIEIAKGKYIARMDCDDISFPERIQT